MQVLKGQMHKLEGLKDDLDWIKCSRLVIKLTLWTCLSPLSKRARISKINKTSWEVSGLLEKAGEQGFRGVNVYWGYSFAFCEVFQVPREISSPRGMIYILMYMNPALCNEVLVCFDFGLKYTFPAFDSPMKYNMYHQKCLKKVNDVYKDLFWLNSDCGERRFFEGKK